MSFVVNPYNAFNSIESFLEASSSLANESFLYFTTSREGFSAETNSIFHFFFSIDEVQAEKNISIIVLLI